MKTIPAREAKNHFGALLDSAQKEPVRITKNSRPVAVLLSGEKFEAFSLAEMDRSSTRKRAIQKLINLPEFKALEGMSEDEVMDMINDEINVSRQK